MRFQDKTIYTNVNIELLIKILRKQLKPIKLWGEKLTAYV